MHETLRYGAAPQRQPDRAIGGSAAVPPVVANRTALPDRLKSGIEALSGISLDNVRVHRNSAKPAALDALAYAQGSDIHLAPGQERHLPHEAWHIVQQAQGRVRPTRQLKSGTPINDDAALEREADRMGAEALRQSDAGAAGQAAVPPPRTEPAQRRASPVIQAALVNPVYAGGTQPTTVTLAIGRGDWPPYGSAPGNAAPDGWTTIGALGLTNAWVRFHVLNQRSGGAGVANNLVPTTQQINQNGTWKGFENRLKIFIDPEHRQGTGAPFASTFNATVAYYGAADDCTYQSAAGNVPVRGRDFPAVILATLDVPDQAGMSARQYVANLGVADGLIPPNQFAPPGFALAAAAAAPAAVAVAPAAPVVAAPAAAAAVPVAAGAAQMMAGARPATLQLRLDDGGHLETRPAASSRPLQFRLRSQVLQLADETVMDRWNEVHDVIEPWRGERDEQLEQWIATAEGAWNAQRQPSWQTGKLQSFKNVVYAAAEADKKDTAGADNLGWDEMIGFVRGQFAASVFVNLAVEEDVALTGGHGNGDTWSVTVALGDNVDSEIASGSVPEGDHGRGDQARNGARRSIKAALVGHNGLIDQLKRRVRDV
jgi:hypothetical protein